MPCPGWAKGAVPPGALPTGWAASRRQRCPTSAQMCKPQEHGAQKRVGCAYAECLHPYLCLHEHWQLHAVTAHTALVVAFLPVAKALATCVSLFVQKRAARHLVPTWKYGYPAVHSCALHCNTSVRRSRHSAQLLRCAVAFKLASPLQRRRCMSGWMGTLSMRAAAPPSPLGPATSCVHSLPLPPSFGRTWHFVPLLCWCTPCRCLQITLLCRLRLDHDHMCALYHHQLLQHTELSPSARATHRCRPKEHP